IAALRDYVGSENPLETAVNGYNIVSSAADLAEDIATEGAVGALKKRTSVGVSITETTTTHNLEKEGSGGIHVFREVKLISDEGDVNVGLNMSDIDRLAISANTFRFHNHELHSSTNTESHSVGVNVNLTGATDVSASQSRMDAESVTQTQRTATGIGVLDL